MAISILSLAAIALVAVIAYGIGLILYRLLLSPLAKFPGPKLAAATHWYQRYFDLMHKRHGGQFLWEIQRMHKQYGPIVRITPDEIHVDDPDFWQQVYCTTTPSKPIDKFDKLRYRFGVPDAVFSTPRSEQHRGRRQAMAGFFSRQRVSKTQARLNALVNRVSKRVSTEYAGSDRVLDLGDMFSSLAVDVVTELCFRQCTNCTRAADFKAPLIQVAHTSLKMTHWGGHFRCLNAWMDYLPVEICTKLVPFVKPILDLRVSIEKQVCQILGETKQRGLSSKDARETEFNTIFDDVLGSTLPPPELAVERLTQEAFAIVSAGMDTVKSTMTKGFFYAMEQPLILSRLKAELVEAMPDPDVIPDWFTLEKLPYLSAFVNESLRLGYGSVQRSPRINRLHPLRFGDWEIPAGTAVGMDSFHMHNNHSVFPDPFVFKPERWLNDPKGPDGIRPLTNYLTSFGGGSRVCIAQHLAYMELFVTFAVFLRRHEFELFETDRSDVDVAHEMLAPLPRWDSQGIRVKVIQ